MPNSYNFSPFTAVTGAYMMCPHLLFSDASQTHITDDTLQFFIKEMRAINFESFPAGDCHTLSDSYVPEDLRTCPRVWVRVDRVRKSLEAPYTGPYNAVRREQKYFLLQLPQGETAVSIDRLKPAYELLKDPFPVPHASVDCGSSLSNPLVSTSSLSIPSTYAFR
ncbi:hypothetical protein E2C01_098368 [Portunus trituberculatus]|uniref:Uncharacterized protein n=1 Tax=Portunus trituberculatus TaxID=210409 RepID=A0A5B7KE08_PORTR|nr:hypothetical protein [Portunus trituberculatus]